jgi:hypothetical protein
MSRSILDKHYKIYGLHLQTNVIISGLVEIHYRTSSPVDIRVFLGTFSNCIKDLLASDRVNYYTSPWHNQTGYPHLTVDTLAAGAYFHFHYDDNVQFILNQAATEVWGTWPENLAIQDTALYFLGPVLGFMLRLRGITCLHASCIAVGEKAFAIFGVSGAGKSTTAAAFAERGYSILSDDVLPLKEIDNIFHAIPGYPRLRLWPSSVEALYGTPDAQPLLSPNWSKRYLDLSDNAYKFRSTPLPLEAIYIIEQRSEDPAAPFIEAIPPTKGLFALVSNTYRNELLDKRMRRQEFDVLGRLVNQVPLRRLTPHTDITKLPELCDKILEDFQRLASNPNESFR